MAGTSAALGQGPELPADPSGLLQTPPCERVPQASSSDIQGPREQETDPPVHLITKLGGGVVYGIETVPALNF